MKKSTMTAMNLLVEKSVKTKLEKLAKKNKMPVSWIVRGILDSGLKQK